MKLKLLVAAMVLFGALPVLVPAASAIPPVCIVKEADAAGAQAEVWVTCGPHASVTFCPKAAPCVDFDTRTLP